MRKKASKGENKPNKPYDKTNGEPNGNPKDNDVTKDEKKQVVPVEEPEEHHQRCEYISPGTNLTLHCSFGEMKNTFKWYKNDEALSGADHQSFTINNFSKGHAGEYRCVIKDEHGKKIQSSELVGIHLFDRNSKGHCVPLQFIVVCKSDLEGKTEKLLQEWHGRRLKRFVRSDENEVLTLWEWDHHDQESFERAGQKLEEERRNKAIIDFENNFVRAIPYIEYADFSTGRAIIEDGDHSTGKPHTQDGDHSTGKPHTQDGDHSTGKPHTQDGDHSTGKPHTQNYYFPRVKQVIFRKEEDDRADRGLLTDALELADLPGDIDGAIKDPIRIAVLDTGLAFDPSKPESKEIWKYVPDQKKNGKIGHDFVRQHNYPDNAENQLEYYPIDDNGHGTDVTNIILGGRSKNPHIRIIPVKTHGQDGMGLLFDCICGVYYAIQQRTHIINISWGFEGNNTKLLRKAVEAAQAKDILIIASAGNSGQDNDQAPHYPSNFSQMRNSSGKKFTNVIAVTGINNQDRLLDFGRGANGNGSVHQHGANWGERNVQIAAKGNGYTSAYPYHEHRYLEGVSYATAKVTNAAAEYIRVFPESKGRPLEVRYALEQGADWIEIPKTETMPARWLRKLNLDQSIEH